MLAHWLVFQQISYTARTTCLGMALSPADWAILHQLTANISHLDTPTSHSDVGIAGGGFPQGLTLGCVMFTVKANWGSHHQNQIQDPDAEDAVCTLDAACKQIKLGLS